MKKKSGKFGAILVAIAGINVAMAVIPGVILGIKDFVEERIEKNK